MLTTVTSKGQVTIPEEIRFALGIVAGDKILFESHPNKKTVGIFKKVKGSVVDRLGGLLKSKVKMVDMNKARKIAGIALGKYYENKLK